MTDSGNRIWSVPEPDKNKRCKTCKQTYADHLEFVLDEWDSGASQLYDPDKVVRCSRFKPMNNLELLEWEVKKREKAS